MSAPPPAPQGPPGSGRVPIFNAPPGTLWACGLLIAIFVVVRFAPTSLQFWAFKSLAFSPSSLLAATETGQLSAAVALRLVTYSLLHLDWLHLLVNVGFLLAFGSLVERIYGLWIFLLLFGLTAICGALAQTWASFADAGPMIGASAAVYGMLGAAIPAMFRTGRRGLSRGLSFIAALMAINLLIAWLNDEGRLLGAPIAWQAHIGGFVAGLAFSLVVAAFTGGGPKRRV